jgi:pimeloyl-ACP methyl ester carboxylesterase
VVARPRILLCPQFTELEWVIAPDLEEWADVATFDAPGVGEEPIPGDDPEHFDRKLVIQRAIEEVEGRGWDSYFVAGDAYGTATAVGVAMANPGAVSGLTLGHASLDYEREGERAAVNGELVAAMGQLLRSDYDSFVRFGITQLTQGGWDEERARQMVERFPSMEIAGRVWETHVSRPEPIGERLKELGKPMLLGEHDGYLLFTPEGYEDAVAMFPQAQRVSVEKTSASSDEFAAALRQFCEKVLATA